MRDVQLYEDAELQRKNLETRLSVLASGDVSAMSMTESEAQTTVRNTGELGTLASGGITQIPSGVNLTVVEPKAAGGYVDYVKYQLHLIASGMAKTVVNLFKQIQINHYHRHWRLAAQARRI